MNNFLIAVAVFLITIVGALFAVPYLVDWNGYRGVFEEEATRLLGREVRVGGAVNLHLLPSPYFRLEKVRIADSSVNAQDAFFRSESLTIKLSVPPIFRGVVEANEIELHRPVLRLAVDRNDEWNWQSFGEALGNAAYFPPNVTLTSVKITDGLVAVHGPDGAERLRLEGFAGELSAPSLAGPYRYRGTFGKAGAKRELRIATARAEEDGAVRFKATIRVGDGASTYTLDGRLADLTGRPYIEGDLSARLPIAGLWRLPSRSGGGTGEASSGEGATKTDKSEPAFDLRAAVRADPAGATLTNLALSFEQDGKPQLLTGEVKALWRNALAVEMDLGSRWLDLDRIAGAGDGAAPLDSMIPLAIGLRDLLPASGRSRASFTVDQANVGREAISNLQLALTRIDDRLEIETLRMGLPGGSRGELKGTVSGPPEAPELDGSLSLRGTSLVRFLSWATAGALTFDAKGDGTFGVRTRLSIVPGRAVARDLVGDISGTAITASLRYRWEGRPELSALVEGPQLDARAFIPAGAGVGDILDLILHGPAASPDRAAAAAPSWRGTRTDAMVRINAGQLITAQRSYRDVALEIELKGGRLRMPLLRVGGDEGFSLEVEGDLDDAASRPKGTLRAVAAAETAAAVGPLAELIGIPDTLRPDLARAQAMVPLRLAGSIAFGVRTPTSTDVVVDGEANGTGVRLTARLNGGQGGWRTGPADLTCLIEGNDAAAVAALLVPDGAAGRGPTTGSSTAAAAGSGRALVKAHGVPAEGLATLASLEAGDLALGFRGQLVAAETGPTASGDLDIKAADAGRMAALAGLGPALRLSGVPLAGSLKLLATGSTVAVDRMVLKLGGSDVKGQLALSGAGEVRRVEARLDIDEVSVPRLLSPLLDPRLAAASAAEAAVTGQSSPWPDEPFDAAALEAFEGTVRLNTGRLTLAEGIGIDRAAIDVALQRGRVEVTRIEGACLGGGCSASLRIDKAAAGVDLAGRLRIAGGSLAAIAGQSTAGTVSGEISFAGKGTSPRAALSVLQGSGTLALAQARLTALWPGAIGQAADAALKTDPDSLPGVVRRALASSLAGGTLPLPESFALEIADGRLRVKPRALETPEGRATGSSSLDLKTLTFESDWRLEQKQSPAAGAKPLPAVTVSYRGPIAALGRLAPRIGSEALERELAVRRMERDVEELERLRKLDEARRREDAERQRRQLEQAPLPPTPPAPVPVAPAARPAAPG